MQDYEPKEIEKKWQEEWEKSSVYRAEDFGSKPKYYALMEFPYPSGDGLHTGHVRGYTAMDIVARKRRMQGYNVLFPIGYDAFGLPTENYAIKTKRSPAAITNENCFNFEKQFKRLGMSFDWSREINTTDPKYYKWTQWIFLKLLENGLAYKAKIPINWCPKDKIGLANEEVIDGKCERCGTQVEKREKEQWMLAITKYADRLIDDLETVDYPERVKIQQKNWIGRSEGAEIEFPISDFQFSIKVFTTRPDTIFGATYMVLAPEHELIEKLSDNISNIGEVREYAKAARNKTDIDRSTESKEKTGVELKGMSAVNPATKKKIPVFIADYVLPGYGTGAIMAVPSDDERDREFAEKYNLPIIKDYPKAQLEDFGKKVTKFKLRDWVFSRQRYWGEPIPVVHCEKCAQSNPTGRGIVPVPESELPVRLPEVEQYEPTESGESPLAGISKWVNTTCPSCGGPAKRETDVMPNWAGSSWYFLAYLFDQEFFDDPVSAENWKLKIGNLSHWMPVDWYNGGMEHTVLHLLYSRFWNKFLFDIGLVPTPEPYRKRTSHGLILAEGGEKMSKSKGNVINPDSIVERFGADSLRLYEMFMGPFEQAIAWSEEALVGPRRFIEKVWRIKNKVSLDGGESVGSLLHQTVKKVGEDIEVLGFNTSISSLMMLSNDMDKRKSVLREEYEILLKLLAPFAPHVTEEIWSSLGHKESIHLASWPKFDETKLLADELLLVVQVNGKVRGSFKAPREIGESQAIEIALRLPEISKWLENKPVRKAIYVREKLVSIVI